MADQQRSDPPNRASLERAVSAVLARLETTQRELAAARREANVAQRIRTEFMLNMSHQLRTPMTAMLGFTDLLLDSDCMSAAERREHLQTIKRNGERLMQMLSDIFDLSRLDAGDLSFERRPVELSDLLGGVARELRPAAEEKGLDFDVSPLGTIPERIETDGDRLSQVLRHLLENAIDTTERGGVRLTVRLAGEGEETRLRFSVADTGPGLSPEELGRIFEPFVQSDTGRTRTIDGAGLGLTIAGRFARVLGGELRAESIEGHGSVFELTIDPGPLEGETLRRVELPGNEDLDRDASTLTLIESFETQERATSVLYVEDGPDNRRLVSALLGKAAIDVTCAENGAEGLERALASREAGAPFDVILMDLQMPVMDGCTATRQLRTAGWTGPIVALTANDLDGMREQSLAAGCNHFLTKPILRRQLLSMILRVLRDRKRRD